MRDTGIESRRGTPVSMQRLAGMVVGVSLVAVVVAASAGAWLSGRGGPSGSPADARAVGLAASPGVAGLRAIDDRGGLTSLSRRRNIFRLSEREEHPAPDAVPAASPPDPPSNIAPEPSPGPRLVLVGVAESGEAGVTVRTAVVSHGGDVSLVREGGTIAGRYRVERITANGAELRDTLTALPVVLRLK